MRITYQHWNLTSHDPPIVTPCSGCEDSVRQSDDQRVPKMFQARTMTVKRQSYSPPIFSIITPLNSPLSRNVGLVDTTNELHLDTLFIEDYGASIIKQWIYNNCLRYDLIYCHRYATEYAN